MAELMVEPVDQKTFRKLYMDGWMSPLQAAKRWGVAERTIYVWLKQGKLKAKKTVDGRYHVIDPKQPKPG